MPYNHLVPLISCAGREKGGTMEEKTFDEIMEEIAMGLKRDPEHDIAYLKEQMESYKDHPLAKEIARACGRLMWEVLPDEKRRELGKVIDNHESDSQSVIDEATYNMKMGNMAKALEIIEPLAKKYDELAESGWSQDDSESVYFNFRSPLDEVVWRVHSDEPRDVRKAVEPFCQVYFMYGSALYEAGRHEEAIAALEKAVRWNPSDLTVRFEVGENYKKLGDMASYERVLDEAHPFIASAEDMARFHRSKGFMLVERESYKLAAAHLMYSLLYASSELALSEIMYIKMKCGEDYTDMTPETAADILEKAGELGGPDRDTLGALYTLIKSSIDNEDVGTAIQSAINLYQLTGDEEIGNLARALLDAVKQAEEEDGDSPSD